MSDSSSAAAALLVVNQKFARIVSALLYGASSIMVTVANKIVLTSYSFPSFQILAVGQLLFSLFGLISASLCGLIKLPPFNLTTITKVMPLPVFYFGNLLFGLGGIKALNLPMFIVLRRFSVLLTMYGEQFLFGESKPLVIQLSVYGMIFGAGMAALYDLKFDLYGYTFIMMNNIFTAANALYIKKKLSTSNLDEYSLLFYNALFASVPMLFISYYTFEINKLVIFQYWHSYGFWFFFLLSTFIGFLLNYSVMLCTRYNSPLTTTVFGCLKNIIVIYVGMFVGGDYVFNLLNFTGLTVSAVSSVFYSYLAFTKTDKNTSISPSSISSETKLVMKEEQQQLLEDHRDTNDKDDIPMIKVVDNKA